MRHQAREHHSDGKVAPEDAAMSLQNAPRGALVFEAQPAMAFIVPVECLQHNDTHIERHTAYMSESIGTTMLCVLCKTCKNTAAAISICRIRGRCQATVSGVPSYLGGQGVCESKEIAVVAALLPQRQLTLEELQRAHDIQT